MYAPVTVLYIVTVLCMDCLIYSDCLTYVLQVGNVNSKHEAARVVNNCAAYSAPAAEVMVQSAGDAPHPTPYTLHPTPHTPHPTAYTLHPTP